MKYSIDKNIRFLALKYPWIDFQIYSKIMISILVSIFLFFAIISYLYFGTFSNALLTAFISTLISVFMFYYYPYLVRQKYVGAIEKDLPFFLLDLDIKLSIGMNFLTSLESVSKEYGYLGDLNQKVLNKYEKGISLHKSFLELSKFYNSSDFSRSLNQIFAIYESGYKQGNKSPIFSLAEELLDKQKSVAKIYHSKLVMASLIFIGVTALLPSLFLVFVTIGGAIMEIGITPIELVLIFTVIFPIVDVIIIIFVYSLMPAYMK